MSFENLSILAFSSSLNTLFFQTVAYFLSILTTMRVFFFPTLSYQSSVPMNYPICSYQLSERIRDSLESVAFWKSSAVFYLLPPEYHDSYAQCLTGWLFCQGREWRWKTNTEKTWVVPKSLLIMPCHWLFMPLLSLLQEGIHICAPILPVSIGQD